MKYSNASQTLRKISNFYYDDYFPPNEVKKNRICHDCS